MPDSTTRWEWRIFGARLAKAASWLAAQQSTGVQESDEVYFLSASPGVAKLRNNLMDIKLLRDVDGNGLERWEPVMKAEFPLSETELAATFEQLQLPRPRTVRTSWSVAEFVKDFAGPSGPLRAVAVHKRRVRYSISGCTMELTDVVADGKPARTLAVEAADRNAVLGVVHAMGYGDWLNASYLLGLAAILGDEPERFAVIDVGTNSVKFHVGKRAADNTWRRVVDRAEVTRLGEGLEGTGAIAPVAMERTAAALRGMVAEARERGVRAIAAVGTAGLRIANNRGAVLSRIREVAGLDVEVISGEEEARLAYSAAVAQVGLANAPVLVFDTGGGSSQFTFGHGSNVDERFSVDVGAVRYTERFGLAGAVTPDIVQQALATIASDLSRLEGRPRTEAVVGMGGAVTNVAAVMHGLTKYDPDVVQGSVVTGVELDRQIARYAGMDANARRGIPGLQAGRAEVILAGACIIRSILDKLGVASLQVSDRGLRHGLLMERFGS
jgi:exopolyphosphatase/guanosine-5'-triphosphate,3'-diphosphate pyrophosphatase